MMNLFDGWKWWEWIFFIFILIITNIIAIPHWIMGRPYWYAKFLDKYFDQGMIMYGDIYKERKN